MWAIGKEQLAIFLSTLLATLATDLLIGIAVGIVVKILIHLWNGAPISSLFRASLIAGTTPAGLAVLSVRESAVFTNWLQIRSQILARPEQKELVVDLSGARLVDHTVMKKLEEMAHDWKLEHRHLSITGLAEHRQMSPHPHAARVLNAAA